MIIIKSFIVGLKGGFPPPPPDPVRPAKHYTLCDNAYVSESENKNKDAHVIFEYFSKSCVPV